MRLLWHNWFYATPVLFLHTGDGCLTWSIRLQCQMYGCKNLSDLERLLQHRDRAEHRGSAQDIFLGLISAPRHLDNAHVRESFLYTDEELDSVHPRHVDVADHTVRGIACEVPERSLSVRRLRHLETASLQDPS